MGREKRNSCKNKEVVGMNIKEYFSDMLTKKELENMPRAFDMVGDIIILNLPASLKKKEAKIGKKLLEKIKYAKVVAKWKGKTSGEGRIRKIKIIAGEKRTETVHRENGCAFRLDINKVYFTPRLVSERKRLYEKVKNNEVIVDMFAGIGPCSIECAKNAKPRIVYSIDINKNAVKYLKENIKLNKVVDKVVPYNKDARKIIRKLAKEGVKADRIIMNLPMSSEKYLNTALLVSKKGTVIHFYHFLDSKDMYSKALNWIKKLKVKTKITGKTTCGQRKPHEYRTCVDFKVE